MASGSFCTSMCVATDMLSATIGNILAYADSPDTAADQIEKAVGEYQSYVVTLAKGLPVHAFKADVGFARTRLPRNRPCRDAGSDYRSAESATETAQAALKLPRSSRTLNGRTLRRSLRTLTEEDEAEKRKRDE